MLLMCSPVCTLTGCIGERLPGVNAAGVRIDGTYSTLQHLRHYPDAKRPDKKIFVAGCFCMSLKDRCGMRLKITAIAAVIGLAVMISTAHADGIWNSAAGAVYPVNTNTFENGLLSSAYDFPAIGSFVTTGIDGGSIPYGQYDPSAPLDVAYTAEDLSLPGEKDPFLAGLLSWFMLGIGQIYVGDYTKGSMFIAGGFMDKIALVLLISHINTKYAPSADEIVNLNWKSFDTSTKVLIVSYLVSSFGLRFYSVVDAVHSANEYNRRLRAPLKREGLSLEMDRDAYSVIYNFQFND